MSSIIWTEKTGLKNVETINTSLIIEAEILNPQDVKFLSRFEQIGSLLREAYVPVEAAFARQFPQHLPQDKFLNSLTPLFAKGATEIDWHLVEKKIGEIIFHFFAEDFPNGILNNEEVAKNYTHLLSLARDVSTHEPLGAAYFMIYNQYPARSALLPIFGVSPQAQGKGIGKKLIDSVFQAMPEVNQVLLSTRITNENAIRAYRHWGCRQFESTLENWINFEYLRL